MRPPNAPPGLRHHLGPGLRGIAPAFIRAGVRFAISLDCCAEYPCQREVAPHVTPRIHIKRPRGAKEHAAALRTLRPGPPVLGAPAVGGPGGSRRLSCIPDVPTGPRRALGSASWALPSPTPAVGGRNTGQTPPNPFYQSILKYMSPYLTIATFNLPIQAVLSYIQSTISGSPTDTRDSCEQFGHGNRGCLYIKNREPRKKKGSNVTV